MFFAGDRKVPLGGHRFMLRRKPGSSRIAVIDAARSEGLLLDGLQDQTLDRPPTPHAFTLALNLTDIPIHQGRLSGVSP